MEQEERDGTRRMKDKKKEMKQGEMMERRGATRKTGLR